MRRRAFDKLMSAAGLVQAVLLVVAGGLLFWANRFVGDNVSSQLSQQKITLPQGEAIADGRTYSEVSGQFQQMDPSDPDHEQVAGQRQALFMGERLRGLLLNAYAFWKMGQIALWASIASFAGAAIFLVLALLGFRHAPQPPADADAGGPTTREAATV